MCDSQNVTDDATPATRWYVEGDLESIARIGARAWELGYAAFLPPAVLSAQASVVATAARWKPLLERPDVAEGTSLALIGSMPVAFVTAARSRDKDASADIGEVIALNVDPDYWGRGIGGALTNLALQRLRDQGFREATLWVYADNRRARQLYERLGFFPDAGTSRVAAEAPTVLEVRYRKPLTAESAG